LSISSSEGGCDRLLVDPREANPLESLIRREYTPFLRKRIEDVLRLVTGRRRDIVERRFGLGGHSPQTLQEVAEVYGLTRERVRQIENTALDVIRRSGELSDLKAFVSEELYP
jgi:DNA-directed RNA polymerase sigma subunit (sigma70/sigma32)